MNMRKPLALAAIAAVGAGLVVTTQVSAQAAPAEPVVQQVDARTGADEAKEPRAIRSVATSAAVRAARAKAAARARAAARAAAAGGTAADQARIDGPVDVIFDK